VCGRETPSGGNTGILAFADHLHAHKPIEHTRGEGTPQKQNRASLKQVPSFVLAQECVSYNHDVSLVTLSGTQEREAYCPHVQTFSTRNKKELFSYLRYVLYLSHISQGRYRGFYGSL